ncbi:MAG: FAD-dependent oxidoreductase [Halobacteriales archaeon]|nr:FAD-dependent oxidoreductase [Halobacteriales archaeon]
MVDTDVIVVGGGPAGLSAALFTAKNGLDTVIFDTDDTWMHHAHLFNYLGIESVDGEAFLETARRQVDGFGADRRQGEAVTGVEATENGFAVTTEDGEHTASYVVLATGDDTALAEDLGCAISAEGLVEVDVTMETTVEDAYATGAMVREEEYQAVISAGDGGAAALNVLTKEKGEHFHDFDTPDDA